MWWTGTVLAGTEGTSGGRPIRCKARRRLKLQYAVEPDASIAEEEPMTETMAPMMARGGGGEERK